MGNVFTMNSQSRFGKQVFMLAAMLAWCAGPAMAEPFVTLSAEASQPAVNDLALATVRVESSGPVLKAQSKKVNEQLEVAWRLIRAAQGIKAKTGNTSTHPEYGKSSMSRTETWSVSSSIELQTGDIAALSDLIGKLQEAGFGVINTRMVPAPETRAKAVDAATLEAIAAFQARAKTIAGAFGKPYKIKEMTVSSNAMGTRMVLAQAEVYGGSSKPMPIQAGESLVGVHVTGKIELAD